MDAFATPEDLAARLNRSWTGDERTWIQTLLEDASAYLREEVLHAQVFPQTTTTFTAWPSGGIVELPQQPVTSILSVTRDGTDVNYAYYLDGVLRFKQDLPVQITFTYGYPDAPESLKRWACVLVSQTLIPLELNLGLTVGGLSSVAIDDFKASFANAGGSTGMALTDQNIASLRDQFGTSVYVQGTR